MRYMCQLPCFWKCILNICLFHKYFKFLYIHVYIKHMFNLLQMHEKKKLFTFLYIHVYIKHMFNLLQMHEKKQLCFETLFNILTPLKGQRM